MRCIVFIGQPSDAAEAFSDWGADKSLDSDVIIRTHAAPYNPKDQLTPSLMILVFYEEQLHPKWDENNDKKIIPEDKVVDIEHDTET